MRKVMKNNKKGARPRYNDWICTLCFNYNYSFRLECKFISDVGNRCHMQLRSQNYPIHHAGYARGFPSSVFLPVEEETDWVGQEEFYDHTDAFIQKIIQWSFYLLYCITSNILSISISLFVLLVRIGECFNGLVICSPWETKIVNFLSLIFLLMLKCVDNNHIIINNN